jgi:hypothetical protein
MRKSNEIMERVIIPTLDILVGHGIPATFPVRVMLYAIGLQESKLVHRYQVLNNGGKGPARGLWQFEKNGGVKGVLNHKASAGIASVVAAKRIGSVDPAHVWEALEYDDILACMFARLLLWTDSKPLPGDKPEMQDKAWDYYYRNWRPGKPHPEVWPGNWREAIEVVHGK